jgi:integrase
MSRDGGDGCNANIAAPMDLAIHHDRREHAMRGTRGWIVTRTAKDGSKRYHAAFRTDAGRIKTKMFRKWKEASGYLAENTPSVQDGTYREIRPITFKEYAEQWLEGLGNLKPSTRGSYASMVMRRLIPAFGDRPMAGIAVEDVNAWLASKEGKLRPKTLRNILALLNKLLGDAQEADHLKVNRLAGSRALRRPRPLREGDEQEIEILTPGEVQTLLDTLPAGYVPLFLTAVSTGMRLGELLGLQWGDVDSPAGRLWVRRTAYRGACTSRRASARGGRSTWATSSSRCSRAGAASTMATRRHRLKPSCSRPRAAGRWTPTTCGTACGRRPWPRRSSGTSASTRSGTPSPAC